MRPPLEIPMRSRPAAGITCAVANRHFGTTVRDDYRWMEDWTDPATRAWVDGENAFTRATLDPLPARSAIRDRITELTRDVSPGNATLRFAGRTLFALKDQPPKNPPMLVVLPSVDDLFSQLGVTCRRVAPAP